MTVKEAQALLTDAMRVRYPATRHVGLLRRRGQGWRCFVRYQLTESDRQIPPTEEADAMLAELAKNFKIVEAGVP